MPPRASWLILGSLASLLLLASGCGKGSSRLAGHWRGVRSEGVPGAAGNAADAFAGKMQIDVTGDVVTVTTPDGKETGHYKVVSEDKTTTVITLDSDAGSPPETFTLVDPKTLRWAVVTGKAVIFTKD
jgi:hypothetical protein